MKWLLLAVLSLATVVNFAQAAADKDFKRGEKAIEKEDWDVAIACFNLVIKRDSENSDAYFHRGTAQFNKEKWDKAIGDFSNVIRLKPNNVDGHYWRARAYYENQVYDKAIVDYNEVVRLKADHDDVHYWRGWAYWDSAKYTLALNDYRAFVNAHGDDGDGHASLANLLATCPSAKLRDGDQAVSHALKACKISQYKESWHVAALAAAYAEQGDFKKAVKWQTKAIDLLGKKPNQDELDDLRMRLKLFENGKAYRIGMVHSDRSFALAGRFDCSACSILPKQLPPFQQRNDVESYPVSAS